MKYDENIIVDLHNKQMNYVFFKYSHKCNIAGFSLAEVLITLAIIGIIAAMTIPGLIANTNDQELKTAWKKAYSDISQATLLIMADNGGTMTNLCSTFDNNCFRDLYSNYLNYTKICDVNATYGTCFHSLNGSWQFDTVKLLNGTSNIQVNAYYPLSASGDSGARLNNGQLLLFDYRSSTCTDTTHVEGYTNACGWITVDVNGFKGPNTVGKDIFTVDILITKTTPTGTGNLSNTCIPSSTGQGCGAKYLYE
ncbi:MAG: type II secretion system protein [Candidatus Gastranaerophilaceae bacterium]